MTSILIRDVIKALTDAIPERWQEDFDNTGIQVGETLRRCTGVMVCVDATPAIVVEAYERGCNLLITHHPLIFHPLRRISGYDRVSRTIYKAIKNDVTIYSCHTSVDNAPRFGVSWMMARKLGLIDIKPIETKEPDGTGIGVIGKLPQPLTPQQFALHVKTSFDTPAVRCSSPAQPPYSIDRVIVGGGACSHLLPLAVSRGAQAVVTSDCKLNHFIDHLGQLFLVDIGHHEAENCTKQIFSQIITDKFPNFAVCQSQQEENPVNYL